ncbi:hypothetical protein [Stetteria hydrogenophila]
MFVKSSAGVEVRVENSRLIVAGREYVREHVIVVGADSLKVHVDPEKGVTLEASFSEAPAVESVERDTVSVKKSGARLALDPLGSTIKAVKEQKGHITVEARVFTVKFEVDENGIQVNIPGVGRLRARKLVIESKVESSVNLITTPFTTGLVSAVGGAKAKSLLRDGLLKVEIEKGEA